MYCGTVASSRCCITDVTRAWPCLLAVIATAATSPSCPSAGGTVWCAGPQGAAGGDVRGEPVSAARVAHWLWGASAAARVARVPLIPLAGAYWAVMRLRAARARADAVRLPLPTIAVGNLSVGGTGKTPLAAWIASYCAAHGRTPGSRLRGYGGDEPLVHRRLVPQAVVVANPDRVAGAVAARAQGAQVVVLDDAYQVLGVERDVNIAVVSAESAAASPWPLPAGPWREGRDALDRADLIVLTRKSASAEAAAALAEQVGRARETPLCLARLVVSHLEGR